MLYESRVSGCGAAGAIYQRETAEDRGNSTQGDARGLGVGGGEEMGEGGGALRGRGEREGEPGCVRGGVLREIEGWAE